MPYHLSYAGDVRLQSLEIEGDMSASLAAHLNLAQRRLTVETARADLLDGEVRITSASFVDLQYHVRTDLIERLRFGSITSLPNRIPILGPVLRYMNPFTLLEGIEIEATVQGNVFRKNAEGKIDIEVNTSILR